MYLKTVCMVDLFGLNPVWHPFIMLFSLRWRFNGLCKKNPEFSPVGGVVILAFSHLDWLH